MAHAKHKARRPASQKAATSPAHSPAPWQQRWNEDDQRTEIYSEGHDLIVANIYDPSDDWLEEHTEWDEDKMQDVRESVQASVDLMTAAPAMLEKLHEYSRDCTDRIDILTEEADELGFDVETEDKKWRESECRDILEQIHHWKATKDMVDDLIAQAGGGSR
jgi:virulence-associated protein VagC